MLLRKDSSLDIKFPVLYTTFPYLLSPARQWISRVFSLILYKVGSFVAKGRGYFSDFSRFYHSLSENYPVVVLLFVFPNLASWISEVGGSECFIFTVALWRISDVG